MVQAFINAVALFIDESDKPEIMFPELSQFESSIGLQLATSEAGTRFHWSGTFYRLDRIEVIDGLTSSPQYDLHVASL